VGYLQQRQQQKALVVAQWFPQLLWALVAESTLLLNILHQSK
jgi:hypothetical protein